MSIYDVMIGFEPTMMSIAHYIFIYVIHVTSRPTNATMIVDSHNTVM
jgi:hypothetical protein